MSTDKEMEKFTVIHLLRVSHDKTVEQLCESLEITEEEYLLIEAGESEVDRKLAMRFDSFYNLLGSSSVYPFILLDKIAERQKDVNEVLMKLEAMYRREVGWLKTINGFQEQLINSLLFENHKLKNWHHTDRTGN
jgi:transcriptional regulator with XRE-family HTH domain